MCEQAMTIHGNDFLHRTFQWSSDGFLETASHMIHMMFDELAATFRWSWEMYPDVWGDEFLMIVAELPLRLDETEAQQKSGTYRKLVSNDVKCIGANIIL